MGNRLAGKVAVVSVPEKSNIGAEYPIAALRGTADPELANEFVQFVLGEKAQAILKNYGFESPAMVQPTSGQGQR